mgnify:CR=1 FL=1
MHRTSSSESGPPNSKASLGSHPGIRPQRIFRTSYSSTRRTKAARLLDALRDLSNKLGSKLRIIIITQEDSDKIAPILTPYISERIGVALDHDKKVFGSFGVDFVPFSVLIDAKNRVLWMGNPQSMTSSFIQKIVQ